MFEFLNEKQGRAKAGHSVTFTKKCLGGKLKAVRVLCMLNAQLQSTGRNQGIINDASLHTFKPQTVQVIAEQNHRLQDAVKSEDLGQEREKIQNNQ